MEQKFISIKEFVERVSVSRDTALAWCQSGKLPAKKIGGKWLINEEKATEILNGGQDND